MKKRIGLFLLCAILMFACLPLGASAARVVLSPQNLTVNGRPVECEKYNIDGSNYFKLRDIAYLLTGTANQFEVGYDPETRTVTITSGQPYTPNGEELVVGMDRSSTAQPSTQSIVINGTVNSDIGAYNLGGNNFFKLRDLGNVLGFTVDYDQASNTAIILSTGSAPDPVPEPSPEPTPEPTQEPEARALTSKEVFDLCSPAVFFIQTYDIVGDKYATGSGFFIDESGIAVTNHHVLENAITAEITLTNGKVCDIAGVLYYDRDRDYAVIQVDGSGFETLKLGDSAELSGGDVCYAIGSPRGLQNTISNGIISNPSRMSNGTELIQTTAPISPGSSGGALINEYGEVVGVTSSSITSGQNLNFAVPINAIVDTGKIRAAKNGGSVLTLPKYAEENAYLEYESLPDMYDSMVYATSGYNELANGDTAAGTISGNNWDLYYVYCNTVGHIEAYLVTDAGTKYAKDITIAAREYDSDDDYIIADYVEYTDGSEGQYLCYAITKPGVYTISILSYSLYETEALNVDYAFYYLFVPGDTNVENTTGDIGENQVPRQQQAFNALKDWILANYNDTIGSDLDKGYFVNHNYTDGARSTDAVIFVPGSTPADDAIALYYEYHYPNGEVDYSYLWISADTQSFYSSYVYFENDTATDPAFRGALRISAPDFSGRKNVTFTDISGTKANSVDRKEMTDLAMISFCESLYFAEQLYAEYLQPNGRYSISDFGFDPNDLSIPD